ncbi:DNA repair protein RadC [Acuticoccus sp. 2012]|uniref:DNA repair protein RadC n=1 Tax=Acuticoccus mangrovi TaxID=2796142 RepID=A0A934IIB8_9HYPH|nr:DNA repair protein RadC [Acuticoccus mangrovi]
MPPAAPATSEAASAERGRSGSKHRGAPCSQAAGTASAGTADAARGSPTHSPPPAASDDPSADHRDAPAPRRTARRRAPQPPAGPLFDPSPGRSHSGRRTHRRTPTSTSAPASTPAPVSTAPPGDAVGEAASPQPALAAEEQGLFGPAPRTRQRPTAKVTDGHRERLRARFDRGETLADYELLELLLFRSVPRRDTKPMAHAMIATFGSFAATLAAPASRLREIEGVGDKVASDFRMVRAAAERFAHAALTTRETLSSTDAVADYYRARLRTAAREEFHVLYLDKKNRFLATECSQTGTVDHTPVYPREVMKRALEHGASAIVLVHNHPSGDPTPSRADVAMTARIIDAGTPLGVTVHDHLIIGGDGYVSLRGEGLI